MPDARDQGKFNARFPPGMRERLAQEARRNNRSMNAEIVARLQATLDSGLATDSSIYRDIKEKLNILLDRVGVDDTKPRKR